METFEHLAIGQAEELVFGWCPRPLRRAALAMLSLLRDAHQQCHYRLPPNEVGWLDRLQRQADRLPEDEATFISEILPTIDLEKVRLDQYGLAVD